MKVPSSEPFQLIYSLYQHEYLGYLFESFVVKLDDNGKLTFQHQNISSKNAKEFDSGLDSNDYKLIRLMDEMQQDVVVNYFNKRKIHFEDFFTRVFDSGKGNNDLLKDEINRYLEIRRAKILSLIHGKMLFEMGNDGEPAWRQIEIAEEKASVLFHFRKNEDNTHYFPTIKYAGEKLDFQYKGAYVICKEPAWLILENTLYSFEKDVDGNKISPFLNKKFIVIPKEMEDTYYRKFVVQLVASFNVYAKGFEIKTDKYDPVPLLTFSEIVQTSSGELFSNGKEKSAEDDGKMLFEVAFQYGDYSFKASNRVPVSVSLENKSGEYTFHRIRRNLEFEKGILAKLEHLGLHINRGQLTLPKLQAFSWLHDHKESLLDHGFQIRQSSSGDKEYFLGQSSISIEVKENNDWFDIHAIVKFGEYEIPFTELRKLMVKGKTEIELPNGKVAVIPEVWFTDYSALFSFMEEDETSKFTLKKHHIALVQELKNGNAAEVSMSRKLEKLKSFAEIDDFPMPAHFKGELRPYQKAGFNWLQFLNNFNFGGCLADDMGLGKTVQTLAMLQSQKEAGNSNASLLIMPTSLIYNWEMEASKFTPELKVFTYTGTNRIKNVQQFEGYDLVLTSYGIARLDTEILEDYYFNYIILDESQAIKNPSSNISRSVKKLNSRYKLILTGTPLENTTLDLWSQMTFINPGLLGNQNFFKNEFLNPIEKFHDENKTSKLNAIIKPFILRRHKSQVATELPEKVETIKYNTMTAMQEEHYEKTKSYYRNRILQEIEEKGVNKSQMILLKGLTKLRQIANHPRMVDEEYQGDSGKLEDVIHMMNAAISEDHKILIFSQFVKHLSIIRSYLDQNNYVYTYLDGATKDRRGQVEMFQGDDDVMIFLISLKAGGLGLNLTKADYVFLLDPWWNPAVESQAIDRAHRIGQENVVFTYKFITKNTVEEKILNLQKKKLKLANDLIKTEESFMKTLKKEDITALFE